MSQLANILLQNLNQNTKQGNKQYEKQQIRLLGKPLKTNLLVRGFSRDGQLVQVNLIITLSLGSMETDRVISEPCYNEVIYNRYITK